MKFLVVLHAIQSGDGFERRRDGLNVFLHPRIRFHGDVAGCPDIAVDIKGLRRRGGTDTDVSTEVGDTVGPECSFDIELGCRCGAANRDVSGWAEIDDVV